MRGEESGEYYLVASCKAEDTYGRGVLFREPNYDFCAVFSEKEFMIIRVGFPYKEMNTVGRVSEHLEDLLIDIKTAEFESLRDEGAIVQATLENRVLNARTLISDPDGALEAEIEYPIKTMNVNDIDWMCQVDTGPLPLPDFEAECKRMVERFRLAFVAFNKLWEAVPAVLDGPYVCDYQRIMRMRAKNEILDLV